MDKRPVARGLLSAEPSKQAPVEHPTWLADIRHMFIQEDIDHMIAQHVNLASYDTVKMLSTSIYGQVASENMPPNRPWSDAWKQTFLNWMKDGCPRGTPATQDLRLAAMETNATTASRVRKDVTALSDEEWAKVVKAFEGIMALDSSDLNSYFVQAGYHWLPAPNTYCMHHAPGYNPWHRAQMLCFENALRSINGCEDVTLPFWDITTPVPERLKVAPFDAYTLPQDIGGGFNKGYTTSRYDYDQIEKAIHDTYDIPTKIKNALAASSWEEFHGYFADAPHTTIIAAHDSGHNSVGPTMQNQDVAAFDPIFWFFHCNWDRLFWKWQQNVDATTVDGLLTTMNHETDPTSVQLFTVPAAGTLAPFTDGDPHVTAPDIADSVGSLDVDYAHPEAAEDLLLSMTPRASMKVASSDKFRIDPTWANIRVTDVNRLSFPGGFTVHLLKDGERIAATGFFQPSAPDTCATCQKNAVMHFDFEVPASDVAGGELSIHIEPNNKDIVGDRVPPKMLGNPSIEVSLKLQNQ
mmetsp:Transcript_23509/g.41452  ORF Transcript_23509/g.41452 Transcript_23509/m.41452 type:complete len:522 (-) Transcript_23509:1260-2825(-)